MAQQRRALALISGGLDSLLATRVVQDQGIHVEGINIYTGFCVEGHAQAIRKTDRKRPESQRSATQPDRICAAGRHQRPASHFKVIVAREEGEGNFLRG